MKNYSYFIMFCSLLLAMGCENDNTLEEPSIKDELKLKAATPYRLRARSTDGQAHVNFKIGNQTVANTTINSTTMADYWFSSELQGDIVVQFDNDTDGRDVQIDYLSVNGDWRQAEERSYNTGVWQNDNCGGSYSEWLHCNGSISFGDAPGSGGGGGGGEAVNPNPSWNVESRIFFDGPAGAFDDIAVKDPSIVYVDGRYHLFFTGRDYNYWRTGYASATTLGGLANANHNFLSSLNGGGYFCAPQVFYFGAKGKWFLIYQSGVGASFSTNTDVGNPSGWSPVRTMGFTDGIDFWVISDGSRVYCFYSAQDGSRSIKRRSTSINDFPYNWTGPTTVATNTFEAPHVYKNLADGQFYMIVEDIARHQELWRASSLGGNWTKVSEEWAHRNDLNYLADRWTDQVSHIEVIRAGYNELLEVDNLNRCQMLIQGVPSGNYGDYYRIPYDLGVIRNY
ncbi:non-reducing end alpha-L-arabinofuranosidase family hydrolase [Fulvivirga sediminis]|uniref:non-reducing end alpha-L-arabinofuranosidase n=1 Tax=Fulvivirga sediminis TaxID=2803949 RepID=A0A937F8Y5_9BACT|nr:non-reducing end alpha-L-arabinofuranosidase family hydrolase [Fulvivirga sediminis]MBL3657202.1 hypothetical protein [Fulvivirga sediminis]